MYIPDPIEILQGQIEEQIDLIDENDMYPCCKCGRKFIVWDMMPVSSHPAAALICEECEVSYYKN